MRIVQTVDTTMADPSALASNEGSAVQSLQLRVLAWIWEGLATTVVPSNGAGCRNGAQDSLYQRVSFILLAVAERIRSQVSLSIHHEAR